jgi:biotin transport system substrate-specific component
MEKTLSQQQSAHSLRYLCLSLLGCSLITLCSLVKIPFYPVPFTLHTLAIFILAFTQTPKQAFGSVLCYLVCGALGFPVFAGKVNALWFLCKCGGYYIAFPIAAYLTARLSQHWPRLLAALCGQLIIFALGFLWLCPYIGASNAWTQGVLLFIPSDLLKIFIAIGITTIWKKGKRNDHQ